MVTLNEAAQLLVSQAPTSGSPATDKVLKRQLRDRFADVPERSRTS